MNESRRIVFKINGKNSEIEEIKKEVDRLLAMKGQNNLDTRKTYTDIKEVWSDLDKGVTIYWASKGYKLYTSEANCDFQHNHFTNRDGLVLSARFIETYWGGLLSESEIGALFSEI